MGERETEMVAIEVVNGKPTIWCDPEIADIVRALNSGGIKTVASCSGHGHRPGVVALSDGRELIIARDYHEARQIDKLFPVDINGDRRAQTPLMAAKAKLRSRGFSVTGNSSPLGEYRIRNYENDIDYRVSKQKLIEIAAALHDPHPNKDPAHDHAVPTDSTARPDSALQVADMSRDERSFLLYAETCCVDGGGLLVGERMNADDHEAAKKFVALGLMLFGCVPSELLGSGPRGVTHYAELTDAGWSLAWELRKARAGRRGPYAEQVFAHPLTIERNERAKVAS